MGLRISINLASLSAQRVLGANQELAAKSMTRLASGDRIASAGDDAAGLSISERLRGQIKSQQQAQRNANDGIGSIQVAEGGLNEISNNLIRIRELAIQAASDTVGDREREFIDLEVQQLKKEIDRVANSTNFNGVPLLNGDAPKSELSIQVGSYNQEADSIRYNVGDFDAQTDELDIDNLEVTDIDDALDSLEDIDEAINKINGFRAQLGAMQNQLQSASTSIGVSVEALSGANSRVRDTDIAHESSELVKRNILNQASIAVLAQANQIPTAALRLL